MNCPYCGREAVWCENKAIYGRNYGKSYMCYLCKKCDAYVGCHNNTKEPLGTMANRELRGLRVKCHDLIDPLWKSGDLKRKEVYRVLEKQWGQPIHIAQADEKLCREIIERFSRLAG